MIVTFTANERVPYMQQVLDSWSNVDGIDGTDVLFRCEPGHPDMVDLVSSWQTPRSVKVTVNDTKQGPLVNPYLALQDAFALDDFAVLAEDDSIVSNDVLDWFNHAKVAYRYDDSILAVCAFQHRWTNPHKLAYQRENWFSATIWGTWRSRWAELDATWDHDYSTQTIGTDGGWDCNIGYRVIGDRFCLFPAQSRSQHIGQHGGTHMPEEHFHNYQSDCYHENYPTGIFHLETQ